MKNIYVLPVIICLLFTAVSCKTNNGKSQNSSAGEEAVAVPDFNADSAYNFVKAQVDFGPVFLIQKNMWHVASIWRRNSENLERG